MINEPLEVDFSLPEGNAADGASERGGANAHTAHTQRVGQPKRVRTPHHLDRARRGPDSILKWMCGRCKDWLCA
eukprot:3903936-Prymnesium_polylepis.1